MDITTPQFAEMVIGVDFATSADDFTGYYLPPRNDLVDQLIGKSKHLDIVDQHGCPMEKEELGYRGRLRKGYLL